MLWGVKVMGVKTDPVVVRPSALAVNLLWGGGKWRRGREGGNFLQKVSPFPPPNPLLSPFKDFRLVGRPCGRSPVVWNFFWGRHRGGGVVVRGCFV